MNLQAYRFRSSPLFDLVSLDRVTEAERMALRNVDEREDLFGLLKPRRADDTVKVVDANTALLFLTLREPGGIPHFAKTALRDARPLLRLIADGILEVELDGEFMSGARAYARLTPLAADEAGGGYLGALSLAAIRYAASLRVLDATRTSERLYCYNRVPATKHLVRDLDDDASLLSYRDRPGSRSLGGLLKEHWEHDATRAGWSRWQSRRDATDSKCKLYVSPAPAATAEAYYRTVLTLREHRVARFKFGRGVLGQLRPDKLVIYVSSKDELARLGDALRISLAGIPSQGVPFSAPLSDDGLLSWGEDPSRTEHLLGWQERPSWRLWLTNRLGIALVAARAVFPDDAEERCRFALARLRLEGIVTSSWVPSPPDAGQTS